MRILATTPAAAVFLLLLRRIAAQYCDANGVCDSHERCKVWEEEGECVRNKQYMDENCAASCKGDIQRKTRECKDLHPRCEVWASLGECEANEYDMHEYCRKACNLCGGDASEAQGGEDVFEDYADEDDDGSTPGCKDTHASCKFWAERGECESNPNWMHVNCPKSCKTCATVTVRDLKEEDNPEMQKLLKQSEDFGERQKAEGAHAQATLDIIRKTITYFEEPTTRSLPADLLGRCRNRHALCSFWAFLGECEANTAYMITNCAPACGSCVMIDINSRCPKIPDAEPALHPGDLNKMFQRIVQTAPGNKTTPLTDEELAALEEYNTPVYSVTVHSRPSDEPATEISHVLDTTLPPWVITFDNFVTAEECQTMIDLGYKYEYKRSEDVGAIKFDGTHDSIQNDRRTSMNAWCSTKEGCRAEAVPKLLHERMSRIMGIPPQNSEDFQMLRYEKGQFYRTHHDYIPHQVDRQCGPRILTFFLYLSDVEAGGGTNFPQLGLTVMPKRGRALLWPSILDSDPMAKDKRMMHQALDVEAGVKYAANGWIHMYDYVTPQERGCT